MQVSNPSRDGVAILKVKRGCYRRVLYIDHRHNAQRTVPIIIIRSQRETGTADDKPADDTNRREIMYAYTRNKERIQKMLMVSLSHNLHG